MSFEFCLQNILNSNNLFELTNQIEEYLKLLEMVKDKSNHIKSLHFLLLDKCKGLLTFDIKLPWYVFDGNESVCLFFKNLWRYQNKYEDNRESLSRIVSYIRNNMALPAGPRIALEDIDDMLELADERFDFSEKVLKDNPLKILFLEHSFKDWNGFYSWGMADTGKIEDQLILTHVNKDAYHTPEFAFMHELGHLTHTRITKKEMSVPDSFTAIPAAVFNIKDPSPEDMTECFAESFAIAATSGTKYNPYDNVAPEFISSLIIYMQTLIQQSS